MADAYRLLRRCAVACFALAVAGCFGPSADKLIDSARKQLDDDNPVAASIESKNLLKDQPESAAGRLLLARALLTLGDLEGAEIEFDRAEKFGAAEGQIAPYRASMWLRQGKQLLVVERYRDLSLPDPAQQVQLHTQLAQSFSELGRRQEADQVVAALLAAAPDSAAAQTLAARFAAERGDMAGARLRLRELLARNPGHAPAWVLQGNLLAMPPVDLAQSVDSFRKALALRGRMAEAHGGLITALLRQRDLNGAKAQFAAMSKALPGQPPTVYFEALLAYLGKDLPLARDLTDRLQKGVSANPQVLMLSGMAHLGLGNLEQAEAALDKASALAPDLAEPRRELGRLYLRRGQPARALEQLKPLLDSNAVDADALAIAAQAHARLGDFRVADSAMASAATLRPGDAGIRTAAALMQIDRGRGELGLRELQASADTQPDSIDTDVLLVAAHMRRNDRAAALKALDAAGRKQPGQPMIEFLRGKVLEQSGDLPGARAAYEKVLIKDGRFRQAVDSLAALDLADSNFSAARKRYEALLKQDPKSASAMMALAEVSLYSGERPAQVTAWIDKSVRVDPLDAANWMKALQLQRSLGDGSATLARAQEAQAALRDDPQLIQQLAAAQLAQGDHQQAISNLRRLQQMQPKSAEAQLQLAMALGASGKTDAARAPLAIALELQPDAPAVVRAAIVLALQDNQPARALQLARDVQRRRPADASGWLLEADFEAHRRNPAAAEAAYRSALAKQESPQTAVKLHRALLATDGAAAQQFSAGWLKDFPKDAYFLVHLAEQDQIASRLPEAELRYRQALQIVPGDALVRNNLANLLLAQKKDAEALAEAQRAVKSSPQVAAVLDTLAAAHAQSRQWSQALDWQRRATELQPNDDGYRLRLVQMLVSAGEKDKAREELAKVLRRGSQSPLAGEAEKLQRQLGA